MLTFSAMQLKWRNAYPPSGSIGFKYFRSAGANKRLSSNTAGVDVETASSNICTRRNCKLTLNNSLDLLSDSSQARPLH